jgi:hypothetical protein
MILHTLNSRDTLSPLVAAAGWVYADSGAFQPFSDYEGVLDVSLAGDINGNGYQDIAIGAGPGGGPRVTIIDSHTRDEIVNLFAFEPSFRGGVTVALDGRSQELLVGAGDGGGAVVARYSTRDWSEIGRTQYGPDDYRGGVAVDADAIGRSEIPAISFGRGDFTIYLDLREREGFEAAAIAADVYSRLQTLGDLIRVTTVEPTMDPNHYLTASLADLRYLLPIRADGVARSTIRDRFATGSRLEVYADARPSPDRIAATLTHEIGHFLGLGHDSDPNNIMHAPAPRDGRFGTPQFDLMRSNLS